MMLRYNFPFKLSSYPVGTRELGCIRPAFYRRSSTRPYLDKQNRLLRRSLPHVYWNVRVSLFSRLVLFSRRIQESNSIKTGALMTEAKKKMALPQLVKFALENGNTRFQLILFYSPLARLVSFDRLMEMVGKETSENAVISQLEQVAVLVRGVWIVKRFALLFYLSVLIHEVTFRILVESQKHIGTCSSSSKILKSSSAKTWTNTQNCIQPWLPICLASLRIVIVEMVGGWGLLLMKISSKSMFYFLFLDGCWLPGIPRLSLVRKRSSRRMARGNNTSNETWKLNFKGRWKHWRKRRSKSRLKNLWNGHLHLHLPPALHQVLLSIIFPVLILTFTASAGSMKGQGPSSFSLSVKDFPIVGSTLLEQLDNLIKSLFSVYGICAGNFIWGCVETRRSDRGRSSSLFGLVLTRYRSWKQHACTPSLW